MSVDPASCMTILKADGTGKTFPFDFRTFLKDDSTHTVKVTSLAADGTYKDYVEGVDYQVDWQPQGGNIEFQAAPPANLIIIIQSAVAMTQHYQFQTGQIPDGFVLTGALDDLTMKIIQCCCQLANKVSIDRDPVTGKIPEVTIGSALQPGKIIETDSNGKIISSNFSKTDLTDLGHAISLAAHNASTDAAQALRANNAAQAAQAAADKFKREAEAAMHLAVTGGVDANKSAVDAKKSQDAAAQSALALQQMQTTLGALATVAGATPDHRDIIMGSAGNKWIKYPGDKFIDELIKLLLNNDEILGKFNDKLAGLPITGLGGSGGGGGGGGLSAIFAGAVEGSAAVANPNLPGKYQLKPVLTGDASNAGKMVEFNAQGGFTAVDPPKTEGAIIVDPGANTGMTINSKIVIDSNRPKGCFPLQACYDDVSNTLTVKEGKIMSGSSDIPDPQKGNQILTTEVASNGGVVYGWHDSLIQKPAQGDDGKVWISDGSGGFVLKDALEASDTSKRIMGVTGVVDALDHVETTPQAQITLKPFKVVHADPTTFVTKEHEFTANTIITIPTGFANNGNFWVYVDPANWAIKTKTTPLTEQELIDNIALLEAHVDNGKIDALNFIYNPISHQEYILREIGLAVGIQTRGIRLLASTRGLVADQRHTGYLFSFLGEGGGNLYPQSTYIFTKTAVINPTDMFIATKKDITKAVDISFVNKYQDGAGAVQPIPAGKFTINHIYMSPLLSEPYRGVHKLNGAFFVLGRVLYDSLAEAKSNLDTSLSHVEVDIGILNNSVLVGKMITASNTKNFNDATGLYINTANLQTQGASIIHSAIVPDPAGVPDGTVLSVKNGKYVFDPAVKAATLDVNSIPANSVLTYENGKITGKSTTAVSTGLNTLDGVYKNVYFVQEIDRSIGGIIDFDTSTTLPAAVLSHNGISKVVQTTTTNALKYKLQKLVVTHIPITNIFAARFTVFLLLANQNAVLTPVVEIVGIEAVSTTETVLHAIPYMEQYLLGGNTKDTKISAMVEIVYL